MNNLLQSQIQNHLRDGSNDTKELFEIISVSYTAFEREIEQLKQLHSSKEYYNTQEKIKELNLFLYSISHDLKAPLSSMLGLVLYAQQGSSENDVIETLKLLETSIKRMNDFIEDILDYSLNSNTQVRNERIDFNAVVFNVKESLKHAGENITINSYFRNTDIPFYSDKRRIEIILSNLVANAIRYYNPNVGNPYINIDLTVKNGIVEIIVEDNGIGIQAKHLDKIFKKFYRVSTKVPGSGLGLYLVKETTEKLNGSISVISKPGEGCRFILQLPSLIQK